jgi:hypothetical protein
MLHNSTRDDPASREVLIWPLWRMKGGRERSFGIGGIDEVPAWRAGVEPSESYCSEPKELSRYRLELDVYRT